MLKKHLPSCPNVLVGEILSKFGHVNGFVLDVGCGAGDPTKNSRKDVNILLELTFHVFSINQKYRLI